MKKLVIAGGSGFLGQVLARHFTRKRWDVVILSRQIKPRAAAGRVCPWDGRSLGPWTEELENAQVLINLCGKSVNCRYHLKNREVILTSRLETTGVLAEALQNAKAPPPFWINAASATIYRHSLGTPMDELHGELGEGFSVDVCRAWETAFFKPQLPSGTRRVALRTSMVLGFGENSVYPILARLSKLWLGGKLSRGDQMVSWIHQSDFARGIEFAIEEETIEGVVNLTAPAPVRNDVFMRALRQSVNAPCGLPHFKPMLELAAWLMRTETELTLKSRYVTPQKLLERRFVFHFPFIDEAFANLARGETNERSEARRCLPSPT